MAHYRIEFNDIFPKEERKSPVSYLEGLGSMFTKEAASVFLSSPIPIGKPHILKFFQIKFLTTNNPIKRQLYPRLMTLRLGNKSKAILLSNTASLSIFEQAIKLSTSETSLSKHEMEIAILKAYLSLNQELNKNDHIVNASISHIKSDEFRELAKRISHGMAQYDVENFFLPHETVTQYVRGVHFFSFVEQDALLSQALKTFCDFYAVSDWNQYLSQILAISFKEATRTVQKHTTVHIPKDNNFDAICTFLDHFISDGKEHPDKDFITIRSAPLFKREKGVYQIIYKLFFAELAYQNLTFRYFIECQKHGVVTSLPSFKEHVGLEFSEKYLMYQVLGKSFRDEYIKIEGNTFPKNFDSPSDYYARINNNAFLFECKDSLVNKNQKYSYSFLKYEAVLTERFRINDKGKRKGVSQLAHSVKNLLQGLFSSVDPDLNPKDVCIYPILVVHHRIFCTPGINKLLNIWFQEALHDLSKSGLNTTNVRNVVVMQIDTLILFEKNFYIRGDQGGYLLEELIDQYFDEVDSYSFEDDKAYTPFSIFMRKFQPIQSDTLGSTLEKLIPSVM